MNQHERRNVSEKSWGITLLCFILGIGLHYFYVGKIGTGILYLVTCGGFYIWWLIDLYKICTNTFTDYEGKAIVRHR